MSKFVWFVFGVLTTVVSLTLGQTQVCQAPFGHFPSNLNDGCTTFYWCWNGRAHLRQCPPGLSFDVNTLGCVSQQQVACVNNNQVAAPQGIIGQPAITGQTQQPTINQVQVAGIQSGPVPNNAAAAAALRPFNGQPVNPPPANVPAQFPLNAGLAIPGAGVNAGGVAAGGTGAAAGARGVAGAEASATGLAGAGAGAGGLGATGDAAVSAGSVSRAGTAAVIGARVNPPGAGVRAGAGTGAGVTAGAGAAAIAGARNVNQPFEGALLNVPGNAPLQPVPGNSWGQGFAGGQGILGDVGQGRDEFPGNQVQGQVQAAGGGSEAVPAVPAVVANQHQSASINQAQTVGVGSGK